MRFIKNNLTWFDGLKVVILFPMSLTTQEKIRYARHLALPKFGEEGQIKLKQARVLVVGAGGLGSPALLYLAAAGIGTLGIVEFDHVAVSNLHRQILFTEADCLQPKAGRAAERLRRHNSATSVITHNLELSAANALEVLQDYDLVVDATDRLATRYLINDACVLLNKPFVYAGIHQYEGQLAVFNYQTTICYRDLFPVPPTPESIPNCETGGVLGPLAGVLGAMQALEAVKIAAGLPVPLAGKLLIYDALTCRQQIFEIPARNERAAIRKLIDYDLFCGTKKETPMKEVTVQELKELLDSKADFQLIDVREPHEYDICNLNGELIPMADVPHQTDRISRSKKVVVHCRSGGRSGNIIQWLEKNHGFTNLYNLRGGILAWADHIDPAMLKY
jgi:adenylyltransferase/sulfurtransferase